MANEDLQQEIELLRQQLDAIKSKQESPPPAVEPGVEEQAAEQLETAPPTDETTVADDITADDLMAQFKELLDSIDKDIKDTKPTTLLIVFALGVLVGRL
ncbi:MAG: hypothetical protein ACN4GR_13420 [Arenicellales bacterium]